MPPLLAALLIVAAVPAAWLVLTGDQKSRARAIRYAVIGALALFGLFLAVRGFAVLDLPLVGVVIYLLRRWSVRGFPGADHLKDWLSGTPHQAAGSAIETPILRITFDQAGGVLYGEVISGQFAGARLDHLDLAQLRALHAECVAGDAQSVRLLESYLDRSRPGWRDQAKGSHRGKRNAREPTNGPMSREEAWQVLGLEPGAGPEQISEAHRRLMMKVHPDHGGNHYLASKVNTAREVLLKRL